MKPIKIVQRETEQLLKTEYEVLLADRGAFESGCVRFIMHPNMKSPMTVSTHFSRPTARRLAAALLKIAGEK